MQKLLLSGWGLLLAVCAAPAQSAYTHFEARQTHPAALTPDGSRLLVLNSTGGRLSVFDVSHPSSPAPVLIAEIPAGIEPVSLRARTSDEVWVVSEVSDSVSIISLSRMAVMDTLRVPDEPADVVFAGSRAFVSCARNNQLRVFDAATRTSAGTIPLDGLYPRALAASPDGSRVYAAFQMSGNNTTILPEDAAPAQPPPSNPALPAPPRTALIVPASDARLNFTVTNHDIAEIDTAALTVQRYVPSVGTHLFDLAADPVSRRLWVAATESLNLTRFEPALRGHFIDHRVSLVSLESGGTTHFDLNPGVDYTVLPNPAAQAAALAQPSGLAVAPDGSHAWVAAFSSDRIARVESDGRITARVDLRPAGSSRAMRGPRGLAWQPATGRLYVLNKLANTVSVVDTATAALLTEVPAGSHDPMPQEIREGRGFLFDARLSGNGTMACSSCHLDADRDGLAWDLGDPGGSLITVYGANHSANSTTLRARVLHPMKGPMVTQTLRGLTNGAPFHWRGDRPSLQSFNSTFDKLMGGAPLPAADMDALAAYLLTLRHHPNPNRNTDRSLPASFAGANPSRGRNLFNDHTNTHCAFCHVLPSGTDNNIDLPQETGSTQPVKNPALTTAYQRVFFNPRAGQTSLSGFGMLHDGTGFALPTVHPYVLSQIEAPADFADVAAFVQCFDSGTAPAVGYAATVTESNRLSAAIASDAALLESQAAAAACDLAVTGVWQGQARSFFYDTAAKLYRPDRAGESGRSRSELLNGLQTGDSLTLMGVPPGTGRRSSIDRDGDNILNASEPVPELTVAWTGSSAELRWPEGFTDWSPQIRQDGPGAPWSTLTSPQETAAGFLRTNPGDTGPRGCFRLRRTW